MSKQAVIATVLPDQVARHRWSGLPDVHERLAVPGIVVAPSLTMGCGSSSGFFAARRFQVLTLNLGPSFSIEQPESGKDK